MEEEALSAKVVGIGGDVNVSVVLVVVWVTLGPSIRALLRGGEGDREGARFVTSGMAIFDAVEL
jgi:hypothetical protein